MSQSLFTTMPSLSTFSSSLLSKSTLSSSSRASSTPARNNSTSNNAKENGAADASTTVLSMMLHHPQFLPRAMEHLQEALLFLPMEKKARYLEACQRCPHLVEKESRPFQFLAFSKFNSWSAAERLCQYWTQRYVFFGPDRAFLPMDLSGEGAFNATDIQLIKSGVHLITSPQTHLIDTALYHGLSYSTEALLRHQFYYWQMLMNWQGDTFMAVISRHENKLKDIHHDFLHTVFQVNTLWIFRGLTPVTPYFCKQYSLTIGEAIPLRTGRVHIITVTSSPHWFHLAEAVQITMQRFGMMVHEFVPHAVARGDQIAASVLKHSTTITAAHLPQAWGGTYALARETALFLACRAGLPVTSPSSLMGLLGRYDPADAAGVWHELSWIDPVQYPPLVVTSHSKAMTATNERIHSSVASNITNTSNATAISPPEDPTLTRGLHALQEAVDMLPLVTKAAYLEAQSRAGPKVMERESSAVSFLQYSQLDSWAAAKRVTSYWKNRCVVFGEQAFAPLTFNGALAGESARDMEKGAAYWLPNDQHGRPVLCIHWDIFCQATHSSRLRIMFFLEAILAQKQQRTPQSMTALILVQQRSSGALTSTLAQQLTGSAKQAGEMLRDCFRLPDCESYVVAQDVPFIQSWVLPLALQAYQWTDRHRFHVHANTGPALTALLKELSARGITQFPPALGGQATSQAFCTECQRNQASRIPRLVSDEAKGVAVEVQRAIAARTDAQALLQAKAKAPHLVAKESDASRYLAYTGNNVDLTAEMMCKYWRHRQALFGSRAFLPLDQTFEGALERKDVTVLQSAFLTHLPCRKDGTSVLFCDGAKLQRAAHSSLLRCAFYIWNVISENEKSQTDGFSLLYLVTDLSFARAFRECLDHVLDCVPAKLKRIHYLGLPLGDGSTEEDVEDQINHSIKVLNLDVQSLRHCGRSRNDLAQALADLGQYNRTYLPVSIAGNWGYQEFIKWQELRIRHEWGLFIRNAEARTANLYNIPTCPLTVDESEQVRNERKRRMGIIHSRQKRERQKNALEELRERAMQLEDENVKLSEDQESLVSLLKRAKTVIDSLPGANEG